MPRRFCLLIAPALLGLLFLAAAASAQGFNTFNGRNHPELDWQVAETAHFRIIYPRHLDGIAAEAAPLAEASYDALAENLGVTFEEKIRIYLSDEDEIANGFAVPLGNGYTNIWVHPNAGAGLWTGREKWLRKVIAHELAHIFHYRAVQSSPRWLNLFLGDALPRFWTEGLAQYQTELWDAQRGDRWLRTAVLDDALSYDDGRSAWNGRLLYAVGNAQVRRFAELYGDSTLAQLLAHRKSVLLGLGRVHDFDDAFEAVTGESYRAFYDDWRRHVNIYYNTMASRLEPLDSLGAAPLRLPGQYLYDLAYGPDTSRVAVLALPSLARPVRRLYVVDRTAERAEIVAEGAVQAPVAWSPDGRRLAYARTVRGRYGSLLNDLFIVDADGRNRRRLTHSRRAGAPTFSPDGQRLAFVASERGTANIFLLDLASGEETALTNFAGDVQLDGLRWHPAEETLVFARVDAEGRRDLVLLDLASGALTPLTDGTHDDRLPVWSPDGTRLAYTSLRDAVPNVFVLDRATRTPRRVTYLATGAWAHDWLPPDSAHADGTLALVANASKQRDRAFRIDAARTAAAPPPPIPDAYAAWTVHRPPREVPRRLPPDSSLIERRYAYAPLANLTHVLSGAAPYYADANDYGVFGGTAWFEPLGKHLLAVGAGLSVADVRGKSFGLATYVNNTLYPTLALTLYRFSESSTVYGDAVLREDVIGGDFSVLWPLDTVRPFTAQGVSLRLRYEDAEPLNPEDFSAEDIAPEPRAGRQAEVRLRYTVKQQRPYRFNTIHPLDGLGLRLQLEGAAALLGADTEYARVDAHAFAVLPALGLQRLYVYVRAQAQAGTPLPQDFIGFSRTDAIQLDLPGFIPLNFSKRDRVRGYRRFVVGDRVLFGTVEYRVPLLPDLQTQILGVISLGGLSAAVFADAGLVWTKGGFSEATRRLGLGAELKNALRLGGLFEIGHAVGVARPASDFGTERDVEVYYRIRAAVPF